MGEEFLSVVRNISSEWTCCRCNREFDYGPFTGDIPEAEEVITDPETGYQTRGGKICKACFDSEAEAG